MIDKVNVLGTDYKIIFKAYNDDTVFEKEQIDGYCDVFIKEIVVCNLSTNKNWENQKKETIERCQQQILRHEIVHAFLGESGLEANSNVSDKGWAYNEEMVDWIALQGEKIYTAWKQADCI